MVLTQDEVGVYVLETQMKGYWPYGEVGRNVLENVGVTQEWARNGKPFLHITMCRFSDEEAAARAARYYVAHMAAAFSEGHPANTRLGELCWSSDNPWGLTVVFQQGPYCVGVGSPLARGAEKAALVEIAGKISAKIAAVGAAGKETRQETLPAEVEAAPAQAADVPDDLKAILLTAEELRPYALQKESGHGWGYGERGDTVLLRPALNQQVTVERGKFIIVTYCVFPSGREALEGATYHSTHMASVFKRGGPEGRTFGDSCWSVPTATGFGAVLFQQGPYCVLIGSPWSQKPQQEAIVEIAGKISAKIAALPVEVRAETEQTTVPQATAVAQTDDVATRKPQDSVEATEQVLKSMPDEDARRLCLERAQEMARAPDERPEQLLLFLRGLGPDEDPPQVAVLRQILRRTKNERVRTEAVRMLAKWLSGQAETRTDVLRVLAEHADDAGTEVRCSVARALGQSGDVRCVVRLAAMLEDEDAGVRGAAADAVCELLGWERPRPSTGEAADAWHAGLRERLAPVLEALKALDQATAQPTSAD